MNLSKQAFRIFGLRKLPGPIHWRPEAMDDSTLSHLGYPLLVTVDFLFPDRALRRWQTARTIGFPSKCCVCLASASLYRPAYNYSKWLGYRQELVLDQVPHCEDHGRQEEAKLIAQATPWTDVAVRMVLIGLNKIFLDETRDLNQRGDVFPPWKAFPNYNPFHPGWRQGNGEYWMTYVWKPFWFGLSEPEQVQYLNRWAAPDDWREFMPLEVSPVSGKKG